MEQLLKDLIEIEKQRLAAQERIEKLLVKGLGILTGIDFCEHDFEYDPEAEALRCKKCPHIIYGITEDMHVHKFELSADGTKKKCKLCPLEIPLES